MYVVACSSTNFLSSFGEHFFDAVGKFNQSSPVAAVPVIFPLFIKPRLIVAEIPRKAMRGRR